MTDLDRVAERIRKLLPTAGCTEAEAASRAAKVQELLLAYNLDMDTVTQGSGGARADERQRGGFYIYERELWRAVAELHFCIYWTQRSYRRAIHRGAGYRQATGGYQMEHRVVGRRVNIAATQALASYLLQTIERLCRERLGSEHNTQFYSRWAVAFREGMADRLTEKLQARRLHLMRREQRDAARAEKAAREAGRAGASTATTLVVSTLTKSEREANIDHVYGEGTSAKRSAQRAEQARADAEAEAEYARWAAANPQEAAKEERREAARERQRWSRPQAVTDADRRRHSGGYYAGYDRADDVGLDTQVDTPRPAGGLTHG